MPLDQMTLENNRIRDIIARRLDEVEADADAMRKHITGV